MNKIILVSKNTMEEIKKVKGERMIWADVAMWVATFRSSLGSTVKLRHNDVKEVALKIWRRNVQNKGSNRFKSPRQERLGWVQGPEACMPLMVG